VSGGSESIGDFFSPLASKDLKCNQMFGRLFF
jgi:hypothetical protein